MGPARVAPREGSSQPKKGRAKVTTAVIGNCACQRLNITTVFDDPQTIAQPLDCRASNEDAAFQTIDGWTITLTPTNSSEEAILRGNTFGACVHEHKVASAIGVLRHTHFVTGLSKGSSLLISGIACHLDSPTEELRIALSKDTAGCPHSGEHSTRHA